MFCLQLTDDELTIEDKAKKGRIALTKAKIFGGVDETAHAIAFAPGYQSVLEAPVHAGAAVTSIPLSPANGWAVDVAAVRAAIRPNTRYMARRPRPDSRDEGSPPTRWARSSGRRRSA